MRNWLMLFALAASMMHPQAGAQQTEANVAAQLPSRLDSFLTANPGGTRTTKFLGSLTGMGKVWDTETNSLREAQITTTFTAMLASLPGGSSAKEKGLEVRIQYLGNHGEQRPHGKVYVDDAILGQFEYDVSETLQLERYWQQRHPVEYRAESEDPPTFSRGALVVYLSGAPEDQGDDSLRRKILAASWYWKVNPAGDEPVGRVCLRMGDSPSGKFYFPETKLEQLIEILAKGRAFLAAN